MVRILQIKEVKGKWTHNVYYYKRRNFCMKYERLFLFKKNQNNCFPPLNIFGTKSFLKIMVRILQIKEAKGK